MPRSSLVDETVTTLLDRIVSGRLGPGDRLPGQDELATLLGVSRLTVREATATLAAGHVLRVEHGNGTFVNPVDRWTDLDAVSRAARAGGQGSDATAQSLIEIRRMIEVGACALAARRATERDLDLLQQHCEAMAEAVTQSDLESFVRHDMAFHARILEAAGNPFLGAVYDPLRRVLEQARYQTSEVPVIRENALDHHQRVLAALRTGDPEAAQAAMDAHMDQTSHDLATHVRL